jgi:hypothetical protein
VGAGYQQLSFERKIRKGEQGLKKYIEGRLGNGPMLETTAGQCTKIISYARFNKEAPAAWYFKGIVARDF